MLNIRHLGLRPYQAVWDEMKQFTSERNENTLDELWLLEHPPVYTQGQAGKPEHIINTSKIPVIQSDRGGQITYHAPGQLVVYILMDIRRQHLGIRTLVNYLEQVLISVLGQFNIVAQTKTGAPGVYVGEEKIASIGLRVKNGCTYHGVALNVAMDLGPFSGINPCGFAALQMTQVSAFNNHVTINDVSNKFIHEFLMAFGFHQKTCNNA